MRSAKKARWPADVESAGGFFVLPDKRRMRERRGSNRISIKSAYREHVADEFRTRTAAIDCPPASKVGGFSFGRSALLQQRRTQQQPYRHDAESEYKDHESAIIAPHPLTIGAPVVLVCLQECVSPNSWSLCQFGNKARRVVSRSLWGCPHRSTALYLVPGAIQVQIGGMQHAAIRGIVDVYVRYANRKALDELRAHRGRLVAGLKTLTGPYDVSRPIAELEDEIAIIEAGLAKLNGAAAA